MTLLSCLAIGVAFLLAVGLLLFAAVVLGWHLPEILERGRRKDRVVHSRPPRRADGVGPGDSDTLEPPGPGAE